MDYKGIELKEFTSDKAIAFDPPKVMLCWDSGDSTPRFDEIVAYLPKYRKHYFATRNYCDHCAEIPEESKPRRATNLELMKWLAQGKGYCRNILSSGVWATYEFDADTADKPCFESFRVRKWEDKEWHEPTADYMGLE